MPKVSVIIPNYNHAEFLERRIDSILNQELMSDSVKRRAFIDYFELGQSIRAVGALRGQMAHKPVVDVAVAPKTARNYYWLVGSLLGLV